VNVAGNGYLDRLRSAEARLSEIEGVLASAAASGADVSWVSPAMDAAKDLAERAREDVEDDNPAALATDVSDLEQALAEMEIYVPLMEALRFSLDNFWYLLGIGALFLVIAYMTTQVLLPFYLLGSRVVKLTRHEKELVQTRVSAEKQYFKREIDEKTFNKILVGKQEEILKTRGQITSMKKERGELLAKKMSPGAMFRWVFAGPVRLARAFRAKPKKAEQKTESKYARKKESGKEGRE
jgi:hypothetical protein